MARTRIYPTNAARGGSATLTGNGSTNDVFTFSQPCQVVLQNDTSGTIYVATDAVSATQGDEAIPAGAEYESDNVASSVAIYGAAGTKVNGTAASQIVLYGVQYP
jgi:hypothetical protein